MKAADHGGNLWNLAKMAQRPPQDLIDFSVNLRPEGTADFLRSTLQKSMCNMHLYPSPHAEEACLAAAKFYQHAADCFVFGNGSNELIHTLARFFAKQGKIEVYIVEPAFSEYALACQNEGLKIIHFWGGVPAFTEGAFLDKLFELPQNSLIFMANPANPSGSFYPQKSMLSFIRLRPDLMWVIDEAFIEYVDDEKSVSLIPHLPKNVIVLRSFTKFYAIAGIRVGFLVTQADLANEIRKILPAWTVNCFAIHTALAIFEDRSDFISKTRQENNIRRQDLVSKLRGIKNIELFPSVANYILFRHKQIPQDFPRLLLKKYGIAIRDCSNYHGLEDKTWYRVAVRFPHEHEKLCKALKILIQGNAD